MRLVLDFLIAVLIIIVCALVFYKIPKNGHQDGVEEFPNPNAMLPKSTFREAPALGDESTINLQKVLPLRNSEHPTNSLPQGSPSPSAPNINTLDDKSSFNVQNVSPESVRPPANDNPVAGFPLQKDPRYTSGRR